MRQNRQMIMGTLLALTLWLHPIGSAWCSSLPSLTIGSKSAVLLDGVTGQTLFEKNPEERMSPASLTKMMTLYLALDAIERGDVSFDLEEVISKKAWKMGGSQMFLEVGDRVKLIELIKGVATISANDGAVAIAEFLTGSEEVFVHQMNERADALGLKHTRFVNTHGLHAEGQETCASDMALLGYHYVKDHPDALKFHTLPTYKYQEIEQKNWNPLLNKGKGVDGLKTGYLKRSGYHILFSAKQDGQRLIGAVMGSKTPEGRDADALKLIGYGFKNFSTRTLVQEGEIVGTVKVPRGDPPELGLSAAENLIVTIPKDRDGSIPLRKEIPSSVDPPVKQGSPLGKLILEGEGFPLREVDLVASHDVQVKSYTLYYVAVVAGVVVLLLYAYWRRRGLRRRRA